MHYRAQKPSYVYRIALMNVRIMLVNTAEGNWLRLNIRPTVFQVCYLRSKSVELFMVALCHRADHYIFMLSFVLLLLSFYLSFLA